MIETKLVNIWDIGKYLLQDWIQITPVYEGKALMQRMTLVKGAGNAILSSDMRDVS